MSLDLFIPVKNDLWSAFNNKYKIYLQQVSRTDPRYLEVRNKHYVPNHGCIGRQIHYLIYCDDISHFVGIISGASAVWACKPRDDFFGITTENRKEVINKIINNVVFRLEIRRPNLGTMVLSEFRKRILNDWIEKYKDEAIGFETFVFGENRNGRMYLADNWSKVGITQGSAKYKPHGAYGIGERKVTDKKIILCKKTKETW